MSRLTKYKKVYEKPTYEKTEPSGGGGIGGSLSGVFTPLELMQQPGGMGGSRLGDFGRRLSKKGVTIGGRRFGIMDLLSLNPTIGTVLAAQKYGKKLADMANMPRMNEGGSVYSRPMFQTPQQRAGGGIMAGIAPIDGTMGAMKLEEGGDPGLLDQLSSYYDENISGIPTGLGEMISNLSDKEFRDEFLEEEFGDTSLIGEGGLLFDPNSRLDQASLALVGIPPLAAMAKLASMGVKGAKLFSQLRKINKANKQLEEINPLQGVYDPQDALKEGLKSSATLQGISALPDAPELAMKTKDLFSGINQFGKELQSEKENDEVNSGGIAMLSNGGAASPRMRRAQQNREEIPQEDDQEEPEYRVNRRGRRVIVQKPPPIPNPPPEQDASTNDPGASEEIVETEEPSLIRGFFDQISNMDPATSAGLIALSNVRPRGQSAFSAFLEGKLNYEQKVAEIEKDKAATIPGQVEAYKEIFPDITDEELQELILSGGKSQEQQIRELAIEIYTKLIGDPITLAEAKEQGFEGKEQEYMLQKAIRDATRIITGNVEGLGSDVDIDLSNKEEA
jgi:hypothetical protein